MVVPIKTQKRPPKPPLTRPTLRELLDLSHRTVQQKSFNDATNTSTNSQVAMKMEIKPRVERKPKFRYLDVG